VKTFDVRIWAVRKNTSSKKSSYQVRWVVAGQVCYETFRTKALAEGFRAKLITASREGEPFDTTTGLPEALSGPRQSELTWYEFAQMYTAMKWPDVSAKQRDSMSETLTAVTMALVGERPGRPADEVLWRALRRWAFVPGTGNGQPDMPAREAVALTWVGKTSLPLSALKDPVTMRAALDALKVKKDGTAAAAETVRRKRAVLFNVLGYAVERGEFVDNPIKAIEWRRMKVTKTVDRRVVVNPRQTRELLTAVTYVGTYHRARGRRLAAMFACMYYAGLRPAEAVGLRESDCHLPDQGWGRLILAKTRPSAGKRWTDSREVHDSRGLKNRPKDDTRIVPIPPELVTILTEHITEFGIAADGRLFRSEQGAVVSSSTYFRVWAQARTLALTPAQVASPMAQRPYDLRHAALSTWLNAGVDPTEVAERAGNSVEVLLSRYAKCLDGRTEIINRRIHAALQDDPDD